MYSDLDTMDKSKVVQNRTPLGNVSEIISRSEQITSNWVSEGIRPNTNNGTKIHRDPQPPQKDNRFLF